MAGRGKVKVLEMPPTPIKIVNQNDIASLGQIQSIELQSNI